MTRETLLFLRELVTRQQIDVGHPNFRETAAQVVDALDALDAALAALPAGDAT